MAPPTATETIQQDATVLKVKAAAAQPEEEEMECQLASMSRGPNPLTGRWLITDKE